MSDAVSRKSYADAVTELRALANRWVLLARDQARESKMQTETGDAAKAAYYRGLAEAHHRLAMELADVVKAMPASAPTAGAQAQSASAAPTASAPAVTYAPVSLNEAIRMLDYAGVSARDVKQHRDNTFSAVFSRWQPFSETERLDLIRSVDPRIIILQHGKLPDSYDLYVDFAFRAE